MELSSTVRYLALEGEPARALAVKPDFILLDEPVAGANRTEVERIARILAGLRAAGVTILLVEHNMDFVMRISDRVTVLNFGEAWRSAQGRS